MILEKDNFKHSITLEPRSLLIFQDEARYKWKHSIPQRKSNIKNRRVSITYRKVIV
jgi:alkylated DNA repair dioxygenase AlkB